MDLSKWKLEIYDLLAIILPGLVVIGEGWVLARGWETFAATITHLTGSGLTVLVLAAFAAGTLVQELSDFLVKSCRGDRFFRSGRDKFWSSTEAEPVKAAINTQLGTTVASVDTAFDYCLTMLKGQFSKRDSFVATSDLCRSFAVLSLLGLVPATFSAFRAYGLESKFLLICIAAALASLLLHLLSWRRMVRFRELSETTVFRAYLATVKEPGPEMEVVHDSPGRKIR